MKLRESRVLVLGASGFLGRAAARALQAAGLEVVGVGRREQVLTSGRRYLRLDLGDADAVGRLIAECESSAILYLAAPSNVQESFQDPEADFRAHVQPLSKLLGKLRQMQRRPKLLLVSSAAVYGEPTKLPVTEDAPIAPVSPYGHHKAIQEQMVREYARLFSVPVSIARIFSVFGPGQRKLAVWEMGRRALRGDFSVRGTGQESRDYIFVDDAVRALGTQLTNASFEGETINVASGRSSTMREVAEALYSELGVQGVPVFDGPAPVGSPQHWQADVSRLMSLGFEPRVALREGLRLTARWMREDA